MNIKKITAIILVLAALVGSTWFYVTSRSVYCVSLQFLPRSELPVVKVTIEGIDYQLGIDLGSANALDLRRDVLVKLATKKLGGSLVMQDVNGGKYRHPFYILPVANMGGYSATNLQLIEDDLGLLTQGCVVWKGLKAKKEQIGSKEIVDYLDGRVGFSFDDHNLFFDFLNGKLSIDANYEYLKKQKIFSENVLVIDLQKTKSGFVIELDTDFGPKKFLLDTGVRWASLKKDRVPADKIIHLLPGLNLCSTKKIGLKNQLLRNVFFHLFDLSGLDENIDGILGMEFLKHSIYLDVKNKTCYIEPMDIEFDMDQMVSDMVKAAQKDRL